MMMHCERHFAFLFFTLTQTRMNTRKNGKNAKKKKQNETKKKEENAVTV
jgi:hypothetical protein